MLAGAIARYNATVSLEDHTEGRVSRVPRHVNEVMTLRPSIRVRLNTNLTSVKLLDLILGGANVGAASRLNTNSIDIHSRDVTVNHHKVDAVPKRRWSNVYAALSCVSIQLLAQDPRSLSNRHAEPNGPIAKRSSRADT